MKKIFIALVLFASTQLSAQTNTWDYVYNVLTTNCAGSGCHDGTGGRFDVGASQGALYTALFNGTPVNATANAKGDKLIKPGYPNRSFLLRKVGHGLGANASADLALGNGEGSNMPDNGGALTATQVEMVRQWILFGAPETGQVADVAVIGNYYDVGGMPFVTRPAAPAAGQGIQIHFGPIFYAPGQALEYFYKYDPKLLQDVAISGITVATNQEVSQATFRKFIPGVAGSWPDGVTPLNPLTAFDSDKEYIWKFAGTEDLFLPQGLAFFHNQGTVLDLNVKAVNGNNSTLPVEAYFNVYFDAAGQAGNVEMKSTLLNNLNIFIPANSSQTFSQADNFANRYIWALTSQTNSKCTDFNMYQSNSGVRGAQLFDGTYNYVQGFDTGVYDWEHPPIFLATDSGVLCPSKIEYEAEYTNNTNTLSTFGFTANDEMMIAHVLYTNTQVYPAPPIAIVGPGLPICIDSATLSLSSSYSTYSWSTGETTPSIVVRQNGTYRVTVTDAQGQTYVSNPYNAVFSSQSANFNYSISNDTIFLAATTTNIQQTYDWQVSGVSFGSGINTYIAGQYGTSYTVYLITNNAVCGTSDTATRTIYLGNVTGQLYADDNSNGQRDTLEQGLAHKLVKILPGPLYAVTDTSGAFTISLPNGNYTATYLAPQYYTNTAPANGIVNFTVTAANTSTPLDFGVFATPNITDVAVYLTTGQFVSGFTSNGWLTIKNLGTVSASGTVTLALDTHINVISAVPAANVQVGQTYTWNYSNLAPEEDINIDLSLQVAVVNAAILTNTTATVTPITGDMDTLNNVAYADEVIVGAYDPNDKRVLPSRDNNETLFGETLDYTIRFQNIGTYKATNVIIEDTLDANLDVSTFEIIASSHAVDFVITASHNVAFNFNNINLPDSTTNEPGSHGFVRYSIKPTAGLAENTEIENTAHIYFDFQPAVVTNTAQSKLVSVLSGVEYINSISVSVYPNPAQNALFVRIDGQYTGTFELFDLAGKKVISTGLDGTIDVSALTQGLYIYGITIDGQGAKFGKVLIE